MVMGMLKVVFGVISLMVLLSGCSRYDWFLVNSDIMARYDRSKGEWQLIWHSSLSKRVFIPDTIPVAVYSDKDLHTIEHDSAFIEDNSRYMGR